MMPSDGYRWVGVFGTVGIIGGSAAFVGGNGGWGIPLGESIESFMVASGERLPRDSGADYDSGLVPFGE